MSRKNTPPAYGEPDSPSHHMVSQAVYEGRRARRLAAAQSAGWATAGARTLSSNREGGAAFFEQLD